MSQSLVPTVLNTRQKTTTITLRKSRKDLEDADGLNTTIRLKQQAIAYLMAGDYVTPSKQLDLHILSHVLLQFGVTNKLPKPIMDSIRAVTFLMEDTYTQQITDNIAMRINAQLTDHMETFATNVNNMRDMVEHVTRVAKLVMGKMDKLNDGFQETADQLAQATQELTEKAVATTNTTMSVPTETPITYAAATQQHIHPDCTTIIAKGQNMAKQILIQKDQNITDNALESLTEKDLVMKANMALDLMGYKSLNRPHQTMFIRAKKLRNGSITYQLNSEEAAIWLQSPDVQKSFMAHFRGTSNIRNKLYYRIAEFVPTTFDMGSSFMHTKLEETNQLNEGSIAFSKYIKAPHLQTNGQKVAHVTFGFLSQDMANTTIRDRLFIEGKHVTIRKMFTELR